MVALTELGTAVTRKLAGPATMMICPMVSHVESVSGAVTVAPTAGTVNPGEATVVKAETPFVPFVPSSP